MNTKALLAQYTPLVNQIAGGFMRKLPRNVLKDDIVAAGMIGLWTAIQKHDGSVEGFEWYARIRIRGSILDELRAQDWLPRRARAAFAASKADGHPCPAVVRFDDVSEWEQNRMLKDAATSEAAVIAKEAQEAIFESLDTLPERERYIVAQHYFEGVKFKDLGFELGVSEPRISQLHSRAMQRLRENASHLEAAL
jgi:RNA polymerase sigma factor FliA